MIGLGRGISFDTLNHFISAYENDQIQFASKVGDTETTSFET